MYKPTVLIATLRKDPTGLGANMFEMLDRNKFNVIGDFLDNYGAIVDNNTNIDVGVLVHGNRYVDAHRPRFQYMDSLCDNVWSVMGGHINSYILYDRTGYSGGSTIARGERVLDINNILPHQYDPFYEYLYNSYVKSNWTKHSQPDSEYSANGPYLLILGQVPTDSAIRCGVDHDYITTMLTAIPILNKIGIKVIYKRHPKDVHFHGDILERMINDRTWENVEHNNSDSFQSLVDSCKAVVTINSGAGFESILRMKKVFTLGRSDYQDGAIWCRNIDDISKIGDRIDDPIDETHIKKFLFAYMSTLKKRRGANTYNELVEILLKG